MTPAPQLRLHVDPQANLPIFAQVRQQLIWLLASGDLRPGDGLPPIRDLADTLGIHMHTVRQAYNALEADGLVESRPGRGTRVLTFDVDQLAGVTNELPSHTIGVLLPSSDPFYEPFLIGLEEQARRNGHLLLTAFTRDQEPLTRRLAGQLLAKGVDGLIAVSPVAGVLDPPQTADGTGPPIVYVDAPQFPANSVLLDLEGAGFQATRHLIQHGHERIAIITAPLAWRNFEQAYTGYRRALRQGRRHFDPALVFEAPAFAIDGGYHAAQRLIDSGQAPTAVFVSGDRLAFGVLQALRSRGLRVPDDIAIASKDNVDVAAVMDPPLTTVAAPAYDMGVQAMEMLQQLLDGRPVNPARRVLSTELVTRRSCGCEDGVPQEP